MNLQQKIVQKRLLNSTKIHVIRKKKLKLLALSSLVQNEVSRKYLDVLLKVACNMQKATACWNCYLTSFHYLCSYLYTARLVTGTVEYNTSVSAHTCQNHEPQAAIDRFKILGGRPNILIFLQILASN